MKGLLLLSPGTPLDSHPAFRASRFDALEEAVATQLSARFVELPSRPAELDARANRFNLTNSSLWFCAYGVPLAIRFPEPDHVRLQFHHAGVGATWIGDALVPVTGNQACVSSTEAEFDFGGDFQQVVWRIPKELVRKKLASLTETPISGELEFNHELDLARPQSQLLTRLLGCAVHAAESELGEPGGIDPVVATGDDEHDPRERASHGVRACTPCTIDRPRITASVARSTPARGAPRKGCAMT